MKKPKTKKTRRTIRKIIAVANHVEQAKAAIRGLDQETPIASDCPPEIRDLAGMWITTRRKMVEHDAEAFKLLSGEARRQLVNLAEAAIWRGEWGWFNRFASELKRQNDQHQRAKDSGIAFPEWARVALLLNQKPELSPVEIVRQIMKHRTNENANPETIYRMIRELKAALCQ